VRGRAVRATEFGVFVELLPGVDGLLHTSEIPRHRQGAVRELVAGSSEIAVMIIAIDHGKRRIALALAPDGATVGEHVESAVTVGAVLTGSVERVEPFGVFVRLGPGQTGLVPNAELGTARGADHRRMFPPGSELKVVVLAIEDGGRRIRLSHEKARTHEEQAEAQAYIKDAARKGRFGMTLGDFLKER
jgi:small subunit ribosomal protein S1